MTELEAMKKERDELLEIVGELYDAGDALYENCVIDDVAEIWEEAVTRIRKFRSGHRD